MLGRFGPDRVVFGGDWPVCTLSATYRQRVEAPRRGGLTGGPFTVGGDPRVDPADFRITTFAGGLNDPDALMTLAIRLRSSATT